MIVPVAMRRIIVGRFLLVTAMLFSVLTFASSQKPNGIQSQQQAIDMLLEFHHAPIRILQYLVANKARFEGSDQVAFLSEVRAQLKPYLAAMNFRERYAPAYEFLARRGTINYEPSLQVLEILKLYSEFLRFSNNKNNSHLASKYKSESELIVSSRQTIQLNSAIDFFDLVQGLSSKSSSERIAALKKFSVIDYPLYEGAFILFQHLRLKAQRSLELSPHAVVEQEETINEMEWTCETIQRSYEGFLYDFYSERPDDKQRIKDLRRLMSEVVKGPVIAALKRLKGAPSANIQNSINGIQESLEAISRGEDPEPKSVIQSEDAPDHVRSSKVAKIVWTYSQNSFVAGLLPLALGREYGIPSFVGREERLTHTPDSYKRCQTGLARCYLKNFNSIAYADSAFSSYITYFPEGASRFSDDTGAVVVADLNAVPQNLVTAEQYQKLYASKRPEISKLQDVVRIAEKNFENFQNRDTTYQTLLGDEKYTEWVYEGRVYQSLSGMTRVGSTWGTSGGSGAGRMQEMRDRVKAYLATVPEYIALMKATGQLRQAIQNFGFHNVEVKGDLLHDVFASMRFVSANSLVDLNNKLTLGGEGYLELYQHLFMTTLFLDALESGDASDFNGNVDGTFQSALLLAKKYSGLLKLLPERSCEAALQADAALYRDMDFTF